LLLRLEELFSPCWLLRLLLLSRFALARSLWARLFWLLALAPLLAALLRPEDDDDDLELRDAIDISLNSFIAAGALCALPKQTLGWQTTSAVGSICALT
jgi:hypothetical protein